MIIENKFQKPSFEVVYPPIIFYRKYWMDWTKMGEDCSSFIHFDESLEIKSRLYGDESPKYAGTLMNKWNSV